MLMILIINTNIAELHGAGFWFQCATLAQSDLVFFSRFRSSTESKFDPTQLRPLPKCVPGTGQVGGQCGQAVIGPRITKVL